MQLREIHYKQVKGSVHLNDLGPQVIERALRHFLKITQNYCKQRQFHQIKKFSTKPAASMLSVLSSPHSWCCSACVLLGWRQTWWRCFFHNFFPAVHHQANYENICSTKLNRMVRNITRSTKATNTINLVLLVYFFKWMWLQFIDVKKQYIIIEN